MHKTHRLRSLMVRLWKTKPRRLRLDKPVICFNFDDFPLSAAENGGAILRRYGHRATYYLSTTLFDYEDHAGRYANPSTVRQLIADGHCIGCHTHGHIDLTRCSTKALKADLASFQQVFNQHFDIQAPRTLSYPYGGTNLRNKAFLAKRFELIRGIGRGINSGVVDLANLRANELSKPDTIANALTLIEENKRLSGLLIFFTHDVDTSPSKHGCHPDEFEKVVNAATKSGARIISMDAAADLISGSNMPINSVSSPDLGRQEIWPRNPECFR